MINYLELADALKEMKPQQKLYEMIKAEMKRRDRWKNKSRGKEFQKGFDSRRQGL
jgi:hypothetical protein